MEFIDNNDEFIFVPRNKSANKINHQLKNSNELELTTDSLVQKKKPEKIRTEYVPPIAGMKRGVNILHSHHKIYKFFEPNDTYNIESRLPRLNYDLLRSMPFDLGNSNSIKIASNVIKIDHVSINIEDIKALRWNEPSGGLTEMTYSFELKLRNEELINYKCTTKDGNPNWFGPLKHLYKDSFSDIWPRLIHRIQKQTIAIILMPIMAEIEYDKEYTFGEKSRYNKNVASYLTINKKGAYMDVDLLFGKKTILVPWYQLSYKITIRGVRINHKLRVAETKYLFNSTFNVFALPVLIDTMKKVRRIH